LRLDQASTGRNGIFGSTVLEVGIEMALLFLFVGLICTAVREGAEAMLKSRAKDLERGIREVLQDRQGTGITASFYNHPLIFSLFSGDYDPSKLKADGRGDLYMPREDRAHLPSYIPALNFAGALLDMAARGRNSGEASATPADQPMTAESLRESVRLIGNEKLQRVVLAALDSAEGDLARAKANLATWYDGTMDRVSGWYKRRTQKILFVLGLAVAVVLNVDAITVAQRLNGDKPLRDAVVGQAANVVREAGGDLDALQAKWYQQVRARLDAIGYPIGWVSGVPA